MGCRCCLGVGAALILLLTPPMRAGAQPKAPVLIVTIYPRATLHDAIDVCPENGFPRFGHERADALRLGSRVIEAMDLSGARAAYDPDFDPGCVFIRPSGPLTVRRASRTRTDILDRR